MARVLRNLLSDYGYNLVALPKEDIAPLLLLYKNNDGVSSAESSLQKLFKVADAPPPQLIRDKAVININGAANITYDAEGGINLLDWLLQKLKMGKLSAKLKLDASNKVNISYENVKEDKVDLLDLDNFISGSSPDTSHFNTFREKLENSELYVVTAVLKSNTFSIAIENENDQQMDVEATLKGIVDANVNVSHNKNNAITLQQDNADQLVFAFKAQRIIYDKKEWWQFSKKEEANFRIKDQQGVILKGEDDYPTDPLKEGETLIDI